MADLPNYQELVLLLGRLVVADRPGGAPPIKARIRELHVEGFYGAYDQATGDRVAIYPAEISEVLDAPPPPAPAENDYPF